MAWEEVEGMRKEKTNSFNMPGAKIRLRFSVSISLRMRAIKAVWYSGLTTEDTVIKGKMDPTY